MNINLTYIYIYILSFFHGQVPIYSFVGNEKFDVPANGQRDYHAVFHCYEKWNFHFKVLIFNNLKFYISTRFFFFLLKFFDIQITFTNEEQEYQFYEIEYEVTEPEVMESIKLTTTVRSEICYPLKFENPLNYVIRLNSHCFNPFVIVKVPRLMPPQSYVSNRYLVSLQTILMKTYIKFLGLYFCLF